MNTLKNIVLISIDDLRFDCITYEKDKRWLERYCAHALVNTPVLDSVGKKGVLFTQCISTSSYTPSPHASMLTGVYPTRHGVKTFFSQLSSSVVTLAEVLRVKGWKTSAWTEHLTFKMQKITRGIETVVEPLADEKANLFAFIDGLRPEHNFVFIHVFDVHKPYLYTTGGSERFQYNGSYLEEMGAFCEKIGLAIDEVLPQAEIEAQKVVANYGKLNESLREYAVFRSLDYLVRTHLRNKGTLLEELIPLYVKGVNKFDQGKFKGLLSTLSEKGFLEDGLMIIASDHGETRCTWNGREDFMNSFNVSEGAIHVPLIMYSGDGALPEGQVITSDVSVIDVMPTILDFLGINLELDGNSLKPLMEGKSTNEADRTLFSEAWAYEGSSTFFGEMGTHQGEFLAEACARKGGLKYLWRDEKVGKDTFYSYSDDPFEEHELLPTKQARALKNELSAYMLTYQIEKMKQKLNQKFKVEL